MSDAGQDVRDRQKMMWSLGDYSVIATILEPAARTVCDACEVGAGTSLLDVGAGTGNLALEAARRGADVIASDLTPHLIEIGEQRGAAEGLSIEWREADAENLPFENDTFDVVTSVFGAIFAPNAERAAAEMVRVTKPGGIVGMTAWAEDGYNGQIFSVVARYLPAPPEGVDLPLSWGAEDVAAKRFGSAGADVEIRRHSIKREFPSREAYERLMEDNAPPIVAARSFLAPEDYERMKQDQEPIRERFDRGVDGAVDIDSDYLLILAAKPG